MEGKEICDFHFPPPPPPDIGQIMDVTSVNLSYWKGGLIAWIIILKGRDGKSAIQKIYAFNFTIMASFLLVLVRKKEQTNT